MTFDERFKGLKRIVMAPEFLWPEVVEEDSELPARSKN